MATVTVEMQLMNITVQLVIHISLIVVMDHALVGNSFVMVHQTAEMEVMKVHKLVAVVRTLSSVVMARVLMLVKSVTDTLIVLMVQMNMIAVSRSTRYTVQEAILAQHSAFYMDK